MKAVKILRRILIVCVILLAVIIGVSVGYLTKQWHRVTYFENTTVNGVDASDRTPEEVLPDIVSAYSAAKIHLTENGEEQAVFTLEELGYRVDEELLLSNLNGTLSRQKSSISVLLDSLLNGNTFQVEVPFTSDSAALETAVTVSALKDERVANQNAALMYDAGKKDYYIRPEVQGTELRDADLQSLVRNKVDVLVMEKDPQDDLTIEIPAILYLQPDVLSTDPKLTTAVSVYNSYDKAEITYTFGDVTETIDWDTIADWVFIEDGTGYISSEKIYEYVVDLASRYNTAFYDRTFTTTGGNTITIAASLNEYGYLVDEEGEYQQLLSDIQANASVTREPVYSHTGIGRSGRDDLAGTYVEISLTAQHLWFYKDYALVTETDVVTGSVAKQTETQEGCFPVAYKESPATLTGQNAENGWSTPVTYWMPFYDGQGLHDATWRSAFGGSIYQTNGSHGCVNVPYTAMDIIFNNIATGTAIILYK